MHLSWLRAMAAEDIAVGQGARSLRSPEVWEEIL